MHEWNIHLFRIYYYLPILLSPEHAVAEDAVHRKPSPRICHPDAKIAQLFHCELHACRGNKIVEVLQRIIPAKVAARPNKLALADARRRQRVGLLLVGLASGWFGLGLRCATCRRNITKHSQIIVAIVAKEEDAARAQSGRHAVEESHITRAWDGGECEDEQSGVKVAMKSAAKRSVC